LGSRMNKGTSSVFSATFSLLKKKLLFDIDTIAL